MRFLLLAYGDENALTETEREECFQENIVLCHDLATAGQFISAAPLQKTPTARSVRIREGKSMVTDGPFAETREQLGGFYMVETATLAEAEAIASRMPQAKWGTVEIRPLVELSGMPEA